jgi:EAL domain-containing protein (putative c-di-GMP-specific phosphodiesterase class I)
MSSEAAERLELEQRLRAAMTSQQFVLLYQPKLSVGDGKIVGAEALLRWLDPERGPVMPGVFLPVLESSRLIIEVGHLG